MITEQDIDFFPKILLEWAWANWQTHRHTHTHIHTFTYTFIIETIKGTPPFVCSEFSGVHFINPKCYSYILESLRAHCKGTHFLFFLLKIFKDCDNLMSLGARFHIFGPKDIYPLPLQWAILAKILRAWDWQKYII